MDSDTEVLYDCTPFFIQYKSGSIVRLRTNLTTPAGIDLTTPDGIDLTTPAGIDLITRVTSKDITISSNPKITARLYLPELPPNSDDATKLSILIYYHGGGFCMESAFSPTYHPFLISLSSQANLLIVSVNYRLAPEHPLPAAYDDSWASLEWAFGPNPDPWLTNHGDFSQVYVAGDSAGANISHHMALRAGASRATSTIKIEGMVLIHPYFWGTERIAGETTDPTMLARLDTLWKVANGSETASLDDLTINPLLISSGFARLGCERVMVCVAEKDVFVERGKAYYASLRDGGWGGTAELVVSKGEEHVFHLMKPECEKALELVQKLVQFIKFGARA